MLLQTLYDFILGGRRRRGGDDVFLLLQYLVNARHAVNDTGLRGTESFCLNAIPLQLFRCTAHLRRPRRLGALCTLYLPVNTGEFGFLLFRYLRGGVIRLLQLRLLGPQVFRLLRRFNHRGVLAFIQLHKGIQL